MAKDLETVTAETSRETRFTEAGKEKVSIFNYLKCYQMKEGADFLCLLYFTELQPMKQRLGEVDLIHLIRGCLINCSYATRAWASL